MSQKDETQKTVVFVADYGDEKSRFVGRHFEAEMWMCGTTFKGAVTEMVRVIVRKDASKPNASWFRADYLDPKTNTLKMAVTDREWNKDQITVLDILKTLQCFGYLYKVDIISVELSSIKVDAHYRFLACGDDPRMGFFGVSICTEQKKKIEEEDLQAMQDEANYEESIDYVTDCLIDVVAWMAPEFKKSDVRYMAQCLKDHFGMSWNYAQHLASLIYDNVVLVVNDAWADTIQEIDD